MLTFCEPGHGTDRRSFLQIGGLALGGLTLAQQLAQEAYGNVPFAKDKSVIFLFMHGGPSQTETFDPKMSAPAGVRSVTGECRTKIPGVTFGSSLERLASLADKLTIVRSFTTGNGRHDIKPIVCDQTLGANIGSIYARAVNSNTTPNGLPINVALFPRAVDSTTMPAITNFGNITSAGPLGAAYRPFMPGGDGGLNESMKLAIPGQRLENRRELLKRLDQARRKVDAAKLFSEADRFQQQAFSTVLGGAARAFDLSRESPATVARYDTAPLVRPDQIRTKWKNYPRYVDNAKTLGKLLLYARRLCEAGCRFVTVTTNFVWDMHADKNNATIEEGMRYMGLPFDYAVSALIEDLHARGLQDKVLLVCCGEMGRTPKINDRGGRDHWGDLAPLMLAGGGLPTGRVVGASNRDASLPATQPVTINHLIATIMHTMLHVGEARVARGIPTNVMNVIAESEPIPHLTR